MASFQKRANGRVRALICVNGIREQKTLPNLKRAQSWARERELEISKFEKLSSDKRTLKDLFQRYADEVSPTKKGCQWELVRLNMLMTQYEDLCSICLIKLNVENFEDFVQQRQQSVLPSTINRELNLISHTLSMGKKWRWISHNPIEGMERPKNPPPRDRRISEQEIRDILFVLGYNENSQPTLKRELVGAAFLFAIETAMRAGEICSLTLKNIDYEGCTAHLTKTKNGDERHVPLSKKAISILQSLPKPLNEDSPIFQLSSSCLSTTFRTHRLKTTIKDLTFHDTRHEATTRLASKLHVLDLARVTGHRNINELLTYYNKSAKEIALQLEQHSTTNTQNNSYTINYSKLVNNLLKEAEKISSHN